MGIITPIRGFTSMGRKENILKRFLTDEMGADLVEWIVVTLLLALAIYALLQAFGPDIQRVIAFVIERFG